MTVVHRNVLVTGAAGFIGRNLVQDQLARGYKVTATDLDISPLAAMNLQGPLDLRPVDIRSTEEMRPYLKGCDAVFHLAAAHLEVLEDDAYFSDINERAAGELAQAAAEEGVRRFVHCSTVGVYGPLESLPADEETPAAPDIAYETSKLAGERAVRLAASNSRTVAVILRPAWVYGPLCPRTLKLVRTIARRRFFFVGEGRNLRHPLFISDMLDAFELAATRPLESGETILVAGPETVSVRQLVELITEELGMTYTPPQAPAWLVRTACLASEKAAGLAGRKPPFSRRSLKFFTESSAFKTGKARELLGFQPKVDTRHGLRLTIGRYREQGIL